MLLPGDVGHWLRCKRSLSQVSQVWVELQAQSCRSEAARRAAQQLDDTGFPCSCFSCFASVRLCPILSLSQNNTKAVCHTNLLKPSIKYHVLQLISGFKKNNVIDPEYESQTVLCVSARLSHLFSGHSQCAACEYRCNQVLSGFWVQICICRLGPQCRASFPLNCWLRAALCVHTSACAWVSARVCVCVCGSLCLCVFRLHLACIKTVAEIEKFKQRNDRNVIVLQSSTFSLEQQKLCELSVEGKFPERFFL